MVCRRLSERRSSATERAGLAVPPPRPVEFERSKHGIFDPEIVIEIAEGPLGVSMTGSGVDYHMQFAHFTGKSDAEEQAKGRLQRGHLLTHVNNTHLFGVQYDDVRQLMGQRPCRLVCENALVRGLVIVDFG